MAEKGEKADKDQRGLVVPHLEAWRLDQALTQRELAAKAGVGRSTIMNAESGKPVSLPNVRKIAAALGISVHQLVRERPNDTHNTQRTSGSPADKAVGAA
jgi:transcriptional regulator with XRE-family HTH domain